MKNIILTLLFTGFQTLLLAESPQVPKEIRFADMRLMLTDGARKEIQTHVDALYRSPKYFQIKLERVDLYFSIIEKVLREENLPEDFKYLVIQESSLISDAVSSSNAVGFWQFKRSTAIEVGLRVDGSVDDRMHIIAATRGAATYLKRNNMYFDNWVYALLAYNMGRGGAQRKVDEKYFGKKKMEINKRTHWYIIKFLAHKVAFENAIGKNTSPDLVLREYKRGANKSLKNIADDMDLDTEMVLEYNKWLKRGKVPPEKTVILPVPGDKSRELLAENESSRPEPGVAKNTSSTVTAPDDFNSDKYPVIEGDYDPNKTTSTLVTVNGEPGIIAGVNVSLIGLAERGEVSLRKFLRYNDLESTDRAIPGQVYYLKRKQGKAKEHYHVVHPGETLWQISQKYGIRLKKLLRRNRMEEIKQVKPGRVLWMRFIRPRDEPIEFKDITAASNAVAVTDGPEIPDTPKEDRKGPENPPASNRLAEENTAQEAVNEISESNLPGPATDKLSKENESPDVVQSLPDENSGVENGLPEQGEFHVQEPVTFVEVAENDENAGKTMHVVAKGETLYGISRAYNVNVGDLLLWNDLQLGDGLKIGQELYVANPEEKQPAEITVASQSPDQNEFLYHEVKVGETMYKIAREYNVTIKEVMEWNMKKDFNVSVGEQLKIMKAN